MEAELGDRHPGRIEPPDRLGEHRRPALDREPDRVRLVVEDRLGGGEVAEELEHAVEVAVAVGDLRHADLDAPRHRSGP